MAQVSIRHEYLNIHLHVSTYFYCSEGAPLTDLMTKRGAVARAASSAPAL